MRSAISATTLYLLIKITMVATTVTRHHNSASLIRTSFERSTGRERSTRAAVIKLRRAGTSPTPAQPIHSQMVCDQGGLSDKGILSPYSLEKCTARTAASTAIRSRLQLIVSTVSLAALEMGSGLR